VQQHHRKTAVISRMAILRKSQSSYHLYERNAVYVISVQCNKILVICLNNTNFTDVHSVRKIVTVSALIANRIMKYAQASRCPHPFR
jgi:hypothetical protein